MSRMLGHSMRKELIQAFKIVRQQTENLCQPLTIEDYVIQSIEDVSPPKWHLAHSSWFFEIFILKHWLANYQPFDSSFHYLFNSYYQAIGHPYPRAKRGLLSRPTVETIYAYRNHVDVHMLSLLEEISDLQLNEIQPLVILGLHHEQQHQELLLMDIKHNFSHDPNFPIYQSHPLQASPSLTPAKLSFVDMEGGIVEIGYRGENFCFDNERPYHKTYLTPYAIASRLVTNEEYLEFIEAGCYKEPRWWLSDGWDCVIKNHWQAPLYWHNQDNEWHLFSLHGLIPLNPAEPVSHMSYYEADAYARWRGARLASEAEWEHFVRFKNITPHHNNFMEKGLFHPESALQNQAQPQQFFGDLWEWTSSPYQPYPGYAPLEGALGEYNGKFMANQMVLRGGCCATPESHIRASYRNFFQPEKRWQFGGIRLAKDN